MVLGARGGWLPGAPGPEGSPSQAAASVCVYVCVRVHAYPLSAGRQVLGVGVSCLGTPAGLPPPPPSCNSHGAHVGPAQSGDLHVEVSRDALGDGPGC